MILLIALVVFLLLGIFEFYTHMLFKDMLDSTVFSGLVIILAGTLLISLCTIKVYGNVDANEAIAVNQAKRDSIVARYNVLPGDHDTYRKLVIANEVYSWNSSVLRMKKLSENIFISWIFNDEFIDSLELIEYGYSGSKGILR